MSASEFVGDLQRGSLCVSSELDYFDGYEQRLARWGCAGCNFFEKKVLSSGATSDELDAYIVCQFAGEMVDLLGEMTDCPKNCNPPLHKNQSRSGRRGRLYCIYRG
jgi:hypothetical protein